MQKLTTGPASTAIDCEPRTRVERPADDGAREHVEPAPTEVADNECPNCGVDLTHTDAKKPYDADSTVMVCDPHCDAPATIGRAKTAIHRAVRTALDPMTTHPRLVAELLIDTIDHASAVHLMRADVGNMPIGQARTNEAFSTASYGMVQALRLSDDPARTAQALRTVLDMVAREAGA